MCQISTARQRQQGLTLIELMVVVAIVGILTAFAVPTYREYMRRGAVEEGLANLSTGRTGMEQFFLDRRTYVDAPCPADTDDFAFACVADATTYTITATGSGRVAGFVYTIDEAGARSSAGPWGSGTCWIGRKGGGC